MQPVLCIATGRSCILLRPLGDAEPKGSGGLWGAPWAGIEMLDGARIHRLSVRPGAVESVFAASWGEGLWFSRDGGRRWSNAGVDIQGSRVHCASASRTGECFVGSEHAILKRAGGDLRRWEMLDNLWLVPSSSDWGKRGTAAIRDVAVNPRHEEWLLAAVDGAGVLFSSDGGFSWDDARANTDPATRRLLWHPDAPTQAIALAPRSLRQSFDGGWSWDESASPLPAPQAAVALPGGQWLIVGESNGRSEMWRGAGQDWRLASRFAPRSADAAEGGEAKAALVESVLAVREEESSGAGAAWLVGWSDGAVEVSTDEGRSWRPLLVDGARPERACEMVLSWADEDLERQSEEQGQAEAAAKAAVDERGAGRFGLGEKLWSSLLDKGGGRV